MKTITNIVATFCFVCQAGAQSVDPVRESSIRLGGAWDEAHGFARQVEMWRLDVDVNGDGSADLLVTRDVARDGKAGNIWDVYLAGDQGYRRLAQPICFRSDLFLLDSYEGTPAIYSYRPDNGKEGGIIASYVLGDQVRTVTIKKAEDVKGEAWMTKLTSEKSQNEEKVKKLILQRPLPELARMEALPQSNFVKRVAELWANGNKLEVYDIACRRLSLNTNDLPGLILKMNCELSSDGGTLPASSIERILDVGATIETLRFREIFSTARAELQQYRVLMSQKSDVGQGSSIGEGELKLVELLKALESDGYFEQGLTTYP